MSEKPILLATRGSALALTQTNMVKSWCQAAFPELAFEVKIIKTTGDKLQATSLGSLDLPKGLFTKELETALLNGEADLAVHSLKDLPTDLPAGLMLGAVSRRADVRDVLVYRDASVFGDSIRRGFAPHLSLADLPAAATVATASTRRQAQLLERRADLKLVPIRGNVTTRLKKLVDQPELDAIVLAAAGLERLGFKIHENSRLTGDGVPEGLLARPFPPEEMLPCVGQAALGIEVRHGDQRVAPLCAKLNDPFTYQCVTAERAFLRAMGGGCQIPVGALAEIEGHELRMRVVSFLGQQVRRAEARRPLEQPVELGEYLATQVRL